MEKNLLDIDRNVLDDEWIAQPKLYFEYAEQLVDARKNLDASKDKLNVLKAELEETAARLDLNIRANPEQYGVDGKITEAVVKNAILLQEEYKVARVSCEVVQREITELKQEVGILEAFISALGDKKSALENLVKLHGQNYFSSPIINNDNEEGKEYIKDILKNKARRKVKQARGD